MSILQSLFAGATALLKGDLTGVRTSLQKALGEAKRTDFGKMLFSALDEVKDHAIEAADRVSSAAGELWSAAQDVINGAYRGARDAWEEKREYEAKRQRDGRQNEADAEREAELAEQLRQFQRDITEIKSGLAAEALRQGEILAAALSPDELSANTGLLANKTCPTCGGTMNIRQGGFSKNKNQHSFYWECISNLRGYRCHTIAIKLDDQDLDVLRARNPDLDGEASKRRTVWTRQDVLAQTQKRMQAFVGEIDDDLMCPIHVAPMRVQKSSCFGGRLLDSYEYACTAVKADGMPCGFVIPICSFPQVASLLRRKTTRGIIDGVVHY